MRMAICLGSSASGGFHLCCSYCYYFVMGRGSVVCGGSGVFGAGSGFVGFGAGLAFYGDWRLS